VAIAVAGLKPLMICRAPSNDLRAKCSSENSCSQFKGYELCEGLYEAQGTSDVARHKDATSTGCGVLLPKKVSRGSGVQLRKW